MMTQYYQEQKMTSIQTRLFCLCSKIEYTINQSNNQMNGSFPEESKVGSETLTEEQIDKSLLMLADVSPKLFLRVVFSPLC